MNKKVSLDDAIRAAFVWDAKRICTPDAMERVWSGFCDKLEEQQIESPEVVACMRKNLSKRI